MQDNYEESVRKEFEAAEGLNQEPQDVKVTDLGQVDSTRLRRVDPNDPEIKRLNELVGYIKLDLGLLPSGGRFYREDFEIHIRAARVGEIRDFSMMDETSLKDADERLNSILSSCSKVMYGTQRGSYKDIMEEDRIHVILSIRELTFKEGEYKLMMPAKGNCGTAGCSAQSSMELRTQNLQFQTPDESVGRYYDPESKSYAIQTKNYGVIYMAPPTIGVMRAVSEYGRKKEEEGANWDKSLVSILPYLKREWRNLTDKEIFTEVTSLQGWDTVKYSIAYRMAEKMKMGVKPEFTFPCQSCGAEITVPLTFPGGIKGLFVIHDLDSELL